MKKTFETPDHIKFANHFHTNHKTSNLQNIIALSQCYANYKTLGVFYSADIMERIYTFEENFQISTSCVKHIPEMTTDLMPESKIEREYYNPKKLAYAQSRVNFTFINFVKSSNNFHLSTNDENTKVNQNDKMEKITTDELKSPELPISLFKENNLLKFEEALQSEMYCEGLGNFQKCYIQMKIVEASLLSPKSIIKSVSEKCEQSIKFVFEKLQNQEEYQCELVFNNAILLGKACSFNKNMAEIEAIKNFHKICVQDIDINKYIRDQNHNPAPPEIESDDELAPEGAEFNDLPLLKDFYLRNNRLSTAIGILQESFQFFKMQIAFSQADDKIHLLVGGSTLASMNFCGNLSLSKQMIANFTLKILQKSKWTLMRNTLYINEFSESINVDKNGLYDINLEDSTKMKTNSNVGGKLMLKMGWDENSGLGKTGHGMKEPIINEMNAKRQGIGFDLGSSKDLKSFCKNVANALGSWMKLENDDLIFDRQFDNTERAMIHKECRKLGLFSKSYNNTNGDRFLVVTYNRSPKALFDWIQSRGGKTKLYTLMPPGTLNCGVLG